MKRLSACTLDCPGSCSLLVETRADGTVRVTGNPEHPITRGVVCAKGAGLPRRLARPDRITRPLLRRDGAFVPVSWDQALDLCAERISRYLAEPASILYLHGFAYRGVLAKVGEHFFGALGASAKTGSMCDEAGCEASVLDFGVQDQNSPLDIRNAARVVNFGRDLTRSSLHVGRIVRQARRAGTRVLTVSPGGEGWEAYSDAHLRIRPGTDRFLAAAALMLLARQGGPDPAVAARAANWPQFARTLESLALDDCLAACGATLDQARELLSWYTRPGPVSTVIGWGVQRHLFGGENVRFIDALALLTGQIGREGAGVFYGIGSSRNLGPGFAPAGPGFSRRLLLPRLGEEILAAQDPPVRMVWVEGMNPLAMLPDAATAARAFASREFVVVLEAFMTDTARSADLILPCALPLEREDVLGSYMHDFVNHAARVLDPPGEARTDFEIFTDLGRRLDPAVVIPPARECLRRALALSPTLDVGLDELASRGFAAPRRPEVAFRDLVFGHGDGLCRLPGPPSPEPPPPPGFPLRLLTLVRRRAHNSQMGEEEQTGPPILLVSPENPECAPLAGQQAFLATPLGRLPVQVDLLEGLHPGSVVLRRGGWVSRGWSANPLIAPLTADLGGQAAYYGQHARLEPGPAVDG